jgi:hypothetical protein
MKLRAGLFSILAFVAAPLLSQDVRLPVLGVTAESGNLLTARGIPGALTWTRPAAMPASFRMLAHTPDGQTVLGVLDSGKVALFHPQTEGLQPVPDLDGGGWTSAVLSPSSRAAALCSPASGRVQTLDVRGGAGMQVVANCAIAVNDAGTAVWVRSSRQNEIILYRQGMDPRYESFGGTVDALAFSASGDDTWIAAGGDLWKIGTERTRLAAGVGHPLALALLSDSRIALVYPDGKLQVRNAGGEPISEGACSCSPSALESTAVKNLFWLSHQSGSPATLADFRDPAPAFWVIPTAQPEVRP